MALETNSDILENECTEKYMCRICFEETTEVGELVSPCKCTGTQKYVHLKCLRRWQENVLRNSRSLDGYDERAIKCSVCRTPFSIPPPVVAWQQRLSAILRGISSALCISLFAFGLSGTRSQSLLVLAVLLAGTFLAALHARGMRVVMRVDDLGQLGLFVIRHGARVEGLRPGALLVASRHMDQGIFHRSVVLLYEHSAAGACGVVLTRPLDTALLADLDRDDAARSAAVSHFVGGPVGMAQLGSPAQERVLLHSAAGAGSRELPLAERPQGAHVFLSTSPSSAIRNASASREPEPRGGDAAPSGGAILRMFHGISSWTEGQLEGEVRMGSWGFCQATLEDLLAGPGELWQRLAESPRVHWL
uniref:Membrane associated ring n=1 Tax=Tetraselmis sp. GSL018 TaxID=582737 RepID=A0A061QNK1_9CHLO